jgi:uncharacterized protein involved in exopolysaccharide biosynthesis
MAPLNKLPEPNVEMAKERAKAKAALEEEIELQDPLASDAHLKAARARTVNRIRLLWSRRKFLGRVAGVGVAAATFIAFVVPKRFTSTARLMPPDQNSGAGAAMMAALAGRVGGGLTSMAENALGVKTTGDLFIGILESNTVRDDVIRKFNLQKAYDDRYVEDCRQDLTDHTDISEDSKSGIITLSVVDHNPKRAAAMAQEYANDLNWVVTHLSTSSAHRERVFLDQRLTEVKSDLESSEKQFSQFASQKGAIDIPTQGKAMVQAAATLQGELIAAESELQGLRQIYTDNNARVRSLEARVDELRTSLRKIGGAGASENSSAEDLYPSLRELPLLGVTYADLLRRTKVEEAVFETLTQQDELAKVQEAKEIPSVKVLDAPQVPERKSFPPRFIVVCFGTCVALFSGICWILARESWISADPTDARRTLAIEVWNDIRSSLPWPTRNGQSTAEATGSQREELHRNACSGSENFGSSEAGVGRGEERGKSSSG